MIALVQRVTSASVTVGTEAPTGAPAGSGPPTYHAAIDGPGLCVLLGVEQGDSDAEATWIAHKLARLRIFRDDEGRMNRSVLDLGGSVLVVSQFTLAGDCSRGHRPSFVRAADPTEGERLYEMVVRLLRGEDGLRQVETGRFGAMMAVALVNDGPVTLIVERRPSARA